MTRFDVVAKVPDKTSQDDLKLMLQSLLTDRFKLVVHKDSRPLPTYALTAGKKLQLKEADGAGDTGCRVQAPSGAPAEGGIRLMMNGGPLTLGPGATLQYSCRNVTMESFAAGLRNMLGVQVGNNPVIDKTGLQGRWNFDVKWSLQINAAVNGPAAGDAAEHISAFDAIEKQLGLKLGQEQVATPVLVVDSVNETSSADSPEVSKVLPVIPLPTAFEVADIKPTDPEFKGGMMSMQAGGRFTPRNYDADTAASRAGRVRWPGCECGRRCGSAGVGGNGAVRYYREDAGRYPATGSDFDESDAAFATRRTVRAQNTYGRTAGAGLHAGGGEAEDENGGSASRTHCIRSNAPPGSPPATQVLTCQNITMAQFADQLRNMVLDFSCRCSIRLRLRAGGISR